MKVYQRDISRRGFLGGVMSLAVLALPFVSWVKRDKVVSPGWPGIQHMWDEASYLTDEDAWDIKL